MRAAATTAGGAGEDLALCDRAERAARPRPPRRGARASARRAGPVPEGRIRSRRVEDRDALARAMAALSAEEREAIALRFGAELTVPEIAAALGVPLTTAEGRVYRALRKLRPHLS